MGRSGVIVPITPCNFKIFAFYLKDTIEYKDATRLAIVVWHAIKVSNENIHRH